MPLLAIARWHTLNFREGSAQRATRITRIIRLEPLHFDGVPKGMTDSVTTSLYYPLQRKIAPRTFLYHVGLACY